LKSVKVAFCANQASILHTGIQASAGYQLGLLQVAKYPATDVQSIVHQASIRREPRGSNQLGHLYLIL